MIPILFFKAKRVLKLNGNYKITSFQVNGYNTNNKLCLALLLSFNNYNKVLKFTILPLKNNNTAYQVSRVYIIYLIVPVLNNYLHVYNKILLLYLHTHHINRILCL